MGVVFVLLLGEIDLSVGFVSGIGAVLVAEFLLQGGSLQLPEWSIGGFAITPYIAIVLAVAAGCLIGFVQGVFVAVIGVPSFIVTLAGLLIWQGVLLAIIGNGGTRRDPGRDDQQHGHLLHGARVRVDLRGDRDRGVRVDAR